MRPRQLSRLVDTAAQALRFLAWAGLLGAPEACPRGHKWGAHGSGGAFATFHCTHRRPSAARGGRGKKRGEPRPMCNAKRSWRAARPDPTERSPPRAGPSRRTRSAGPTSSARPRGSSRAGFAMPCPAEAFCPLAGRLPNSVGPGVLLELLFWFAVKTPVQAAAAFTGVDRGTVRRVFYVLRLQLLEFLAASFNGQLGGPGRVVVVDETCVTRPKRSRTLHGRRTRPMQIWVVAGVELDLQTRKLTGRAFLRLVNNRSRATMEHVLRTLLVPGAEVWTDDWAAYQWLDEEGPAPQTGFPGRGAAGWGRVGGGQPARHRAERPTWPMRPGPPQTCAESCGWACAPRLGLRPPQGRPLPRGVPGPGGAGDQCG